MSVVRTCLFVVCGGWGSDPVFVRSDRTGLPPCSEIGGFSPSTPCIPRAMCGLRPSVIAVTACCGRGSKTLSRARSMIARHRCPRLLSSGVVPYRARCVVNVRTSSPSLLVIVGDRTLLLLLSPRCVTNVRTSSLSSLVIVRDRTLLLLLSLRCVLNVRLSSLVIVGDRTLLLLPRCVVNVRASSLSSLVTVGDRTLCYYYRRDVWPMFGRPHCHRL